MFYDDWLYRSQAVSEIPVLIPTSYVCVYGTCSITGSDDLNFVCACMLKSF